MAAQEVDPLRGLRPLVGGLERAHQRPDVAGGQRVEQPLVDREVQHHLQPVAEVAEVVEALVGRHVRLGEQDGVAAPPLQEVAHLVEQLVVLARRDAGSLLLDQERHRVHAEAADAELQPEAHDAVNLAGAPPGSRCSGRAESRRSGGSSTRRPPDRGSTSPSARPERPCPCSSRAGASSTRHTSRDTATAGPSAPPGTRDDGSRCD